MAVELGLGITITCFLEFCVWRLKKYFCSLRNIISEESDNDIFHLGPNFLPLGTGFANWGGGSVSDRRGHGGGTLHGGRNKRTVKSRNFLA